MAHAIAPGAAIVLMVSKELRVDGTLGSVLRREFVGIRDAVDSLAYAVNHDLGDVISQSFGYGEQCVPTPLRSRLHRIYQAASRRGITIVAASGDFGAAGVGCDFGEAIGHRGVGLPAADPLVTAVGGTSLELDSRGRYLRESAWGDSGRAATTLIRSRLAGAASGGGISHIYPRPRYQDGLTGIGDHRGIPDVAFAADPFQSPGIVAKAVSSEYLGSTGGTSMGAPAWAGIVALADEYAHRRLGAIDPSLYRIARGDNYSRAFHDIRSGDNTVRVVTRPHKVVAVVHGYRAGPGWDAVTGLGTPQVGALVPLLARSR